jgi:hypothetical protein
VVYGRRAQVHSSMTVRVGRSLRDRRYSERRQQDDSRHKKIALVTTANYPAWVRWAMLKRVSIWEEDLAVANSRWLCRND